MPEPKTTPFELAGRRCWLADCRGGRPGVPRLVVLPAGDDAAEQLPQLLAALDEVTAGDAALAPLTAETPAQAGLPTGERAQNNAAAGETAPAGPAPGSPAPKGGQAGGTPPAPAMGGQEAAPAGHAPARHAPFVLAAFQAEDWDRQLTPWPAPALFKGQAGFAGGAADTLDFIKTALVPEASRRAGLPADAGCALLGYSLAACLPCGPFCRTAPSPPVPPARRPFGTTAGATT